ncbi:hypothetical protein [Hymenobacter cellulosilyticus]|uniref:Uncharacterized protein n=1 Tax=Hymenobacter cellulosilyticus TaxID=2932248 RepID=A0A8T9Q9L4_9BACT|nr:hypothetical protein [Hymenobacter cellulosilyticus]UOQ73101.1 hypothetical protein MUN79_03755 [Hymenobacter cellulosilyticus]
MKLIQQAISLAALLLMGSTSTFGQDALTSNSQSAVAQSASRPVSSGGASGGTSDRNEDGLVTSANFATVYNQKVTHILTGDRNVTAIGNYLSINIIKPSVTLNGFIPTFSKNTSNILGKVREKDRLTGFFSGNANVSIVENTVSLFQNNKVNSNVELKLGYSFVVYDAFWSYGRDREAIAKARTEVEAHYRTLTDRELLEKQQLNALIKQVQAQIKEITDSLREDSVTEDEMEASQLNSYVAKKIYEKDLLLKLAALQSSIDKKKIEKARKDSVLKVDLKARWSTVELMWIDILPGGKQQKFYLYDENATYSKQVIEKTRFNGRLAFAFNRFVDSRHPGYKKWNGLMRLEYAATKSNNIASLQGMDISSKTKIDTFQRSREILEKVTAYKITQYKPSKYHDIRFDWVIPMDTISRINLHPYFLLQHPFDKWRLNDIKRHRATQNAGMGFITTLKNKENTKVNFNIELYFELRDISNTAEKMDPAILPEDRTKTFQRNEFGIRVTTPFGFTKQ